MNNDENNQQDKFKIQPPSKSIIHRTPLTNQAQEALYFGILSCIPMNMLQLIPPLQNYSYHEIEFYLRDFLKNPPIIHIDSNYENLKKLEIPFDVEEDLAIITMIRTNTGPFSIEFIKKFSFIFKPIRTIQQIKERFEQLQTLSPQEIDAIYDEFTKKTYQEYLSFKSLQKKKSNCLQPHFLYDICTFSRETPPQIMVLPEIDSEIDHLSSNRNVYLKNHFCSNDLAILRTEKFEFIMKQTSIIIGKNTDTTIVDIDLNFLIQPGCQHISKRQAILSFQEFNDDYCFVLENIGKRSFRVNGSLIPQGKACILQSGSIIDFSDILFMFISNDELIDRIKQTIRHQEMAKSFLKKKKKKEGKPY